MMKSLLTLVTAATAAAAAFPAQAAMVQYDITGATNVRFVVNQKPKPDFIEDYARAKSFRLRPVAGTTVINGVRTDVDLEIVYYDAMNMGGLTVSSGKMVGDGSEWYDWETDFRVWMSAETEAGDAFYTGTVQNPTLLTGRWTLSEWPFDGSSYVMTVTQLADNAVPEPASWAMMIGGFGLVGAAARRRSATLAFA